MAELPALLTVEEAGRLLRIGRTKAYAMAKQWRETGGASGLPVLDLGDVLRVPLAKLEAMTGASFSDVGGTLPGGFQDPRSEGRPAAIRLTSASNDAEPAVQSQAKDKPAPARRRRQSRSHQLDLFDRRPPSD